MAGLDPAIYVVRGTGRIGRVSRREAPDLLIWLRLLAVEGLFSHILIW
jgi:hypothetical protein